MKCVIMTDSASCSALRGFWASAGAETDTSHESFFASHKPSEDQLRNRTGVSSVEAKAWLVHTGHCRCGAPCQHMLTLRDVENSGRFP